jgi:hypothetical protein
MKYEALRLADELEMWTLGEPAAAELRRLHAQRDQLLEALRPFVTIGSGFDMEDVRKARAAIKAVEERK